MAATVHHERLTAPALALYRRALAAAVEAGDRPVRLRLWDRAHAARRLPEALGARQDEVDALTLAVLRGEAVRLPRPGPLPCPPARRGPCPGDRSAPGATATTGPSRAVR